MKRMRAIALAVTLVFLAGLVAPQPARADLDVSLGFFYSNLSPHGSWHVSGQYGHVWQPSVYRVGWNPYYDGHWAYTDLGWSWVSDYRWGAIPYHYGTWVFDPVFGWVWVPGYTWAPAWVVFRTGPDYIGWAPVSPHFSIGFSGSFGAPASGSFVFVSAGDFVAPRIRSVVVPQSRATVVVNRTRVVNNLVVENNIVVNRGPDIRHVERASGRKVRRASIESVRGVAPGGGFSRADLRVDRQRSGGRIRAAEPVPKSQALPRGRDDRDRSFDRRSRDDSFDQRSRPQSPQNRSIRDREQIQRQRESSPESRAVPRGRDDRDRSFDRQQQQRQRVDRQQEQRQREPSAKKTTKKKKGGQEQEKSKQGRQRGGGPDRD